VQGDNQSKERAEKELQRLHETIAQKEGELERIKPQYEEMKKREEECTREYVDRLVIILKKFHFHSIRLVPGWVSKSKNGRNCTPNRVVGPSSRHVTSAIFGFRTN
jgi:hypothetical protein